MPVANRPDKRMLVRWTDDLDKSVLLAIQYACTEAGIKIPWARVAEVMGHKFSEGSIIQHLAKLRTKMTQADLPVPPPLKRGMVTKAPSSIYAPTPKKRKASEALAGPITPPQPSLRRSNKAKGGKRVKAEMSDEDIDDDGLPVLFDSDEEYGTIKRKVKKVKKVKKEPADARNSMRNPVMQNFEEETESEDGSKAGINETDGPAARTRGRKTDYANLEDGKSDEDVEADFAEEEQETSASSDTDGSPTSRTTGTEKTPVKGFKRSTAIKNEKISPVSREQVDTNKQLMLDDTSSATVSPVNGTETDIGDQIMLDEDQAANMPFLQTPMSNQQILPVLSPDDFHNQQNAFGMPIHPSSLNYLFGQQISQIGSPAYTNLYGTPSTSNSTSVAPTRNNSYVSNFSPIASTTGGSHNVSNNIGSGCVTQGFSVEDINFLITGWDVNFVNDNLQLQ